MKLRRTLIVLAAASALLAAVSAYGDIGERELAHPPGGPRLVATSNAHGDRCVRLYHESGMWERLCTPELTEPQFTIGRNIVFGQVPTGKSVVIVLGDCSVVTAPVQAAGGFLKVLNASQADAGVFQVIASGKTHTPGAGPGEPPSVSSVASLPPGACG